MRLTDIPLPYSAVAGGALEVVTAYGSPALLNHSIRSYFWAAAYGATHAIPFDAELLYVAAALHDLGLMPEFDSHTVPFEQAGGDVAWVFGAGAGWPVERRAKVREVIVLHMLDDVTAEDDPEAHLLQIAVTLDVSGGRSAAFPDTLKQDVLAAYPRLGWGKEFITRCEAQAARKPDSAAAAAIRGGIAERVAVNPLDHIF